MSYKSAIARLELIANNGSSIRGTGTLVTDRYVLTALHVIADRTHTPPMFYSSPITLRFSGFETTATVVNLAWDAQLDWVLLECSELPPILPAPLGEVAPGEQDVAWETFGFPDTKPDGMRVTGIVRDLGATYQGVQAIQLYSVEAAAGQGAPISGLSGAPCIVDGAVVGVIRYSLMSQGLNVAGTMFACPITAITDSAAKYLHIPDPLRGLPGLPRRKLPNLPFRYLHHYTRDDAEVFFGRATAIRDLYDKVVTPGAAQIIVVLGQSGVGKSSLLDAGLIPRVAFSHSCQYVRRDHTGGLGKSFQESLEQSLSNSPSSSTKPTLIVLDQVEEAWTRPCLSPDSEIHELLDCVKARLVSGSARGEDRVILSIRKDWAPDLEARLVERDLFFTKYFLERLTPVDIEEVVHGLARTDRLRMHYQTEIEEGLGSHICSDLLADQGSAVAPMLQVWMTRLWQDVSGLSPRVISESHYLSIRQQLPHLQDFLRSQIESLSPDFQKHVSSGLVEDLLDWHTTRLDTSETRSRSELLMRYPHHPPTTINGLIESFIDLYLLTGAPDLQSKQINKTRLSHDTLAPIVRDRFRSSQKPGQRATRILESKLSDHPDSTDATLLDDVDLSLVENGKTGMRVRSEAESELVARSQAASITRKLVREQQ